MDVISERVYLEFLISLSIMTELNNVLFHLPVYAMVTIID